MAIIIVQKAKKACFYRAFKMIMIFMKKILLIIALFVFSYMATKYILNPDTVDETEYKLIWRDSFLKNCPQVADIQECICFADTVVNEVSIELIDTFPKNMLEDPWRSIIERCK